MLVKAAFYKEGKVAVFCEVEVFKLCIIVDQRSRLHYNEHVSISFFSRVHRVIGVPAPCSHCNIFWMSPFFLHEDSFSMRKTTRKSRSPEIEGSTSAAPIIMISSNMLYITTTLLISFSRQSVRGADACNQRACQLSSVTVTFPDLPKGWFESGALIAA